MQRRPTGGYRSAFSDEAISPLTASPSTARSPFHHGGRLQNLGSLYKQPQDDLSGYYVPPPEYAGPDFSYGDYASGGGGFSPPAALSLTSQLQSMRLDDSAIFSALPPGGFTTMPQWSRPTTGDLPGFSDQIEGRSGYLPVQPQLSLTLRDFRGKISRLSMDRDGSRHLQKMIEQGVEGDEIDIALSETINRVGFLMVDKFANYVILKLVEVSNPRQVTRILAEITRQNQVVDICLNKYGFRVMQKILNNITTGEQIYLLMTSLVPAVVTLVNDNYGHHVVEMCLDTFPSMETEVLYRNIIVNCYTIATDKCGCRVLQDIIKSAENRVRIILMKAISRHSLALTTDLYGNYVVQFLLDLEMPELTACVIMQLRGHFAALSCNKYGSHVVEKCMKLSATEDFAEIILELLQNQHHLLVLDQYGNYIMTCAFALAKERRLQLVYSLLVGHVDKHYDQMRGHFYGNKALKRLKKQDVQLPLT